jgi:uncharacterized protein YqeY
MSLKEQITEAMKAAMRAKDAARLSTIRLLLAAIKQREVDDRVVADDALVIAVTDKLIKQRRDSITQFEAAGREDLAAKERAELQTLSEYLPRQADAAEIAAEIDAAVAQVGAAGPQDMGKVMAVLKPKLAGRADLSAVSGQVKARLSR